MTPATVALATAAFTFTTEETINPDGNQRKNGMKNKNSGNKANSKKMIRNLKMRGFLYPNSALYVMPNFRAL